MNGSVLRSLGGGSLLAALLASVSPAVPAAETGNVCVHDFASGVACEAADLAVSRIQAVTVLEDCPSGDPATAEAVLRVWISAAVTRYDAGVFLALDGGSALSGGNCLHDFLEPPLHPNPSYGDADGDGRPDLTGTPWWNGEPFEPIDQCGDALAGTDSIKTLPPVRIACTDRNGNGIVDLSTCSSWSNGTSNRCQGLSQAYPPASSRCGCAVVETGIPLPGTVVPAGRVDGLAVARLGSGDLQLSWGPSCAGTDADFEVYEGPLGSFGIRTPVACSTGGATTATFPPGPGSSYYLVVPRNDAREGSYGTGSTGAERAPAAGACLPQAVQGVCV